MQDVEMEIKVNAIDRDDGEKRLLSKISAKLHFTCIILWTKRADFDALFILFYS